MILLRKYGPTTQKTFLCLEKSKLRTNLRKWSFLVSPRISGWAHISHLTLKTSWNFLKTKDGLTLLLWGAKIPVRHFFEASFRFRVGEAACCTIYVTRRDWPFPPPLKKAERSDSHCHHAKSNSDCGSVLVFMNFEKGTVSTKPLLFVLTNCLFWWIKCHDCNPRLSLGTGTESLPDSLCATILRVLMTSEESQITGGG